MSVYDEDILEELRAQVSPSTVDDEDILEELRSQITGRPIRALNGEPPAPTGMGGRLLDSAIDSGSGVLRRVPGVLSEVRRAAVPMVTQAAGAVAGGASPLPGGAFLGATAGSVAGDALNRLIDGEPVSDAFSLANVARGGLYSSLSGRGLADAVKLTVGNTFIDNALDDRPEDEDPLLRLGIQTLPALVAPAYRALRNRGVSSGPTAAQLAAQDAAPELFPRTNVVRARPPAEWLAESGIAPAGPTPEVPDPGWGRRWLTDNKTVGEMRSVSGLFSRRNYPAAQEIAKRQALHHDIARDIETNGKAIVADVMGRLTPDERKMFADYVIWDDMRDSFAAEMIKAHKQASSANPASAQAGAARLAHLQGIYARFSPAATNTPQHVVDAANEIRMRVLQPFDEMNVLSGRKTVDTGTGEVFQYRSRGPKYFPRQGKPLEPGQDPITLAIKRGDMTSEEAALAQLQGNSPDYLVKARQDPIFDPARFTEDPQLALDKYVEKNSKQYALRVAWGDQVKDAAGNTTKFGADAVRLLDDLSDSNRRLDRNVFARYLSRIYSPQLVDETILGNVKRAVSNVALPFSGANQVPQAGNNIGLSGFGNSLRGMLRARSEGERFSLAGANDPALRNYYTDTNAIPETSLPMRLMGAMESNWNRKYGATGFGPHLRSLGQQALEERAAGNGFSRRLQREALSVYDTPPDVLADETALYGEPSFLRPLRKAIDTAQFHAEAGDVPESMRTGPLALLTQYKGFPFRQTRLFGREAIGPMLEGIREQDMGLFDLGLERTARMLPSTIGLKIPITLALGALRGRDTSLADAVTGGLSDATGFYGPAANFGLSIANDDPINPRDVERSVIPPSVSIGANALREGASGDIPEFLMRYALPAANLSGTGIEGMVLPPLHQHLFKERRRRR